METGARESGPGQRRETAMIWLVAVWSGASAWARRGRGGADIRSGPPWPWVCAAALLPTLWAGDPAGPGLLPMPWSGAALLVLLGGWRASVAALFAAAAALVITGQLDWIEGLQRFACAGLLPATLMAVIRRTCSARFLLDPLVQALGVGFAGTLVVSGVAGITTTLLGTEARLSLQDLVAARLLMATAEASVTVALLATVAVWRPDWLEATAPGGTCRNGRRGGRGQSEGR